MKFFYSCLNDLMPAVLFIIATSLINRDYYISGCIVMILAYFSLDVHTYVSKKLGFHNNIFFKQF